MKNSTFIHNEKNVPLILSINR